MDENTWKNEAYTLSQFVCELLDHIEAKGGPYGGLNPPAPINFDATYADTLLLKNGSFYYLVLFTPTFLLLFSNTFPAVTIWIRCFCLVI
jgi:hypothetical protein